MKPRTSWTLWIVLTAAACIGPCVVAQQPAGGPPTPEQELQMNIGVLNKLRADPQAKPSILARRKEVLARRGVADPDTRLAGIGKIFDEAMAMPATDFEKNQQQLAKRIIALMQPTAAVAPSANPPKAIPFIDVHAHLIGVGMMTPQGMTPSAKAAVELMDKTSTRVMIVMPPPGNGHPHAESDIVYERALAAAVRHYPTRFLFLAGGGSFETLPNMPVTAEMRRRFEQRAEEILRSGARGFGELALLHTPFYESVPGDHPLMLLLSDIAARHDAVLDIHMEVVTEETPLTASQLAGYEAQKDWGWLNAGRPRTLTPNVPGFERLLDHNPKTKIILEHLGNDFNTQWTAALSRHLLEKHPNLYMSLRLLSPGRAPENNPLAFNGTIRPEWIKLFQDFPTRFLLGLDRFIAPSDARGNGPGLQLAQSVIRPEFTLMTQRFLNALPPDLARKIACENAMVIYKLAN